MLYMVTFTINIHQMLAYIPYMDPMGFGMSSSQLTNDFHSFQRGWLKHVETTNQFSSAILMRTKNDVNNGKLLNYQRDPEGMSEHIVLT